MIVLLCYCEVVWLYVECIWWVVCVIGVVI